jgi:hypothetical protein
MNLSALIWLLYRIIDLLVIIAFDNAIVWVVTGSKVLRLFIIKDEVFYVIKLRLIYESHWVARSVREEFDKPRGSGIVNLSVLAPSTSTVILSG